MQNSIVLRFFFFFKRSQWWAVLLPWSFCRRSKLDTLERELVPPFAAIIAFIDPMRHLYLLLKEDGTNTQQRLWLDLFAVCKHHGLSYDSLRDETDGSVCNVTTTCYNAIIPFWSSVLIQCGLHKLCQYVHIWKLFPKGCMRWRSRLSFSDRPHTLPYGPSSASFHFRGYQRSIS